MKKLIRSLFLMAVLVTTKVVAQPFTPPTCIPAANQLANPQITTASGVSNMITNTQYTAEFRFQNAGDDPIPASTLRLLISIDDSKIQWGSPILVDGGGVWELSSDPNEITSDAIVLYNTGGTTADGLAIDVRFNVIPLVVGVSPFNTSVNRISPSCVGDTDASAANNGKSATLTASTVLPVKLVSFNAAREGIVAQLSWATTEEINSDHFEVQQSTDIKSWKSLGNVASNGESTVRRNYTYSHQNPSKGVNYYRLKIVDKDGSFEYSTIRSLNFEGIEGALAAYPNPANNRVYFKNVALDQVSSLRIYSLSGNKVIETKSLTAEGIDTKKLAPGLYLAEILLKDGTISQHKITVTK